VTARDTTGVIGLAIALTTCGSALAQPAPSPARPTRASITSPAQPPASYDRRGRRDPFQPIQLPEPPPPVKEVKLVVASARLKGIIRGGTTRRALLETPDGVGYIMKPGDTLAEGRLIEIGTDRVVFYVLPKPGLTTDHVVLRLPTE
jgi:glyoxylase-like metal-dependent hydrolase (beta-lactamase superfamily II)